MEKEAILRAVLSGIPKVAAQITLAPFEERSAALDNAERSYVQIARDIGYAQETARRWVSAIMDRLRAKVEANNSALRPLLKKLYEEVVRLTSSSAQEFARTGEEESGEKGSVIEIHRWPARKTIH